MTFGLDAVFTICVVGYSEYLSLPTKKNCSSLFSFRRLE